MAQGGARPEPPAADRLAPLAERYRGGQGRRRRQAWLAIALTLLLAWLAAWVAQVDPGLIWAKGGNILDYFRRLLTLESGAAAGAPVWQDPAEWFWGWRRWLRLLGDTLLMAYLGTLAGALGGFLCGLLAARNIGPGQGLRWVVTRGLEVCRTVPDIVFALVFVIAFGLGPLPGVLAIAIHTLGALGKQITEVVENIDMRPVEGAIAAGAAWPQMAGFAVVPQVLPGVLGYALLRFEINVRSAAVLGFVGAGGIGQELIEAIRKFYYNDVSALLVLIILTVMLIDATTSRVRLRLLEGHAA
ncbi:phosphonate ABC transporter, permease protein PhnE [Roseicella frigidaeris]|uniref:Phosphonate ABC transporter, permease protein PhnE n=1 Tax=Roseicella frigidaeris TaxID=2230885 RepID=A0A327MFK4_9PROT|nr:phosphonate ABC transporter, permease protein PhnE [Roseicella frigidaeris]RAI60843.1 phosphonate ABC transporter, permease protein PhnE [Roseicella frigidaeris]